MTGRTSFVAAALALLVACGSEARRTDDTGPPSADPTESMSGGTDTSTSPTTDPSTDPSTGHPGNPPGDGTSGGGDDTPPAPACPIGAAAFRTALGLAGQDQVIDLAVDAAGDAVVATTPASTATGDSVAMGVTRLSPSGAVVFSRPWGSVVATDRAGNTFIAGAFTQPMDFGLGMIAPQGNIDVFVVELDAHGKVVFARALGLCGDGVTSIAVDASGRIAVSGSAMGTAVLAPDGTLLFDLAVSGSVAFDSHGNLVIAGTFTTSVDLGDGPIAIGDAGSEGFVLEVDRDGQRVFSQLLPGGGVHATGVAIDAHDAIVVVGYYERSIDLFGDRFEAIVSSDAGRVTGAYVIKLDDRGNLIWKLGRATGVEANGVAVDLQGNILVAGATAANVGFFRDASLIELDPAGHALPISGQVAAAGSGASRGFQVATGACGSVFTTFVAHDTPGAGSPIRAFVMQATP